jgi:hypothetical protein
MEVQEVLTEMTEMYAGLSPVTGEDIWLGLCGERAD